MLRIKRAFLAIYYILYMKICKILLIPLYFLNPELKQIWLISERGVDARDNGYCFYKYLRTQHKEINAWYIIDKSSADYKKVKEYGNIIQYKSFKHILFLTAAKVQISTHDQGCTPDMVVFHWLNKHKMVPGKKVFLQHGIIKDNIKWYHAKEFHTDLFVCTAKEEYEYVVNNYGHPDGTVRLLGLCRYDDFDRIDSRKTNQILFMPTWRSWLNECNESTFMNSQYYNQINKLLNDETLEQFLEENGYRLLFYPHYESQKYIHCFETKSEHIEICSFNEYDVHSLLKESDILITDYSSVFFDMAYQDKPILFFQYDKDEFETHHYQKGYMKYSEFGPVSLTVEELNGNLITMIKNQEIEIYKNRYHQFFGEKTNNNCRLIWDAINQIL